MAPVTHISDYLLDLAKSHSVVPTTLDCIKSCIVLTIKACIDVDYSNDYALSAILSKYHRECPADVFRVPDWNLVLVLEMLCKAPFEPLYTCSIKHLTYKCVFLVAMATSCRISELHAIDFRKVTHDRHWQQVFLEPKLDFLAKNQSSRAVKQSRTFVLKALVKHINQVHFTPGSLDETLYNKNKLLCPVRALKWYMSRTKFRRHNKKALFISLHANHKNDITKQSIANWIRKTIVLCYALAGDNTENLGRATVHEIRSLSASVKFDRNLSIDSLLKSCVWKNGNTFTKHYLRDVSVLSQELHRLPPLCMSQTVVNT